MGETTEATLKEIAETRAALGEKVDALAIQVRQTTTRMRKTAFKVAAITGVAVAALLIFRQIRSD